MKTPGLIVNPQGVIGPNELYVVSDVLRGYVERRWQSYGLDGVASVGSVINRCADKVHEAIREQVELEGAPLREIVSLVLLGMASCEVHLIADVNLSAPRKEQP